MATILDYFVIGCWIVYLVYWFISARRVKVDAEKQSRAARRAYRIPEGLGWMLMVYWKLPPPMNRVVIPHTDLALATGAIVCVLGLFVTIWARVILAGNWSRDTNSLWPDRTGLYDIRCTPVF